VAGFDAGVVMGMRVKSLRCRSSGLGASIALSARVNRCGVNHRC